MEDKPVAGVPQNEVASTHTLLFLHSKIYWKHTITKLFIFWFFRLVQDMCASNPCLHEGTCIDMDNNTFKCLCKGGWKGLNCEGISSDVCLPFNKTLR